MKNVYQISKILGWSYGKTERKISSLIGSGRLYTMQNIENGRSVRYISRNPISYNGASAGGKAGENHVLVKAYRHLYGIFKKLSDIKHDPTPGLISYCEENALDPPVIIRLLDEARKYLEERSQAE
ncbi:MAG: hypothetical protein ACTSUE_12620 [Promethearchaeota archaeon]